MKYIDMAKDVEKSLEIGLKCIVNNTLPSFLEKEGVGWHEQWMNADYSGVYAACEGIILLSQTQKHFNYIQIKELLCNVYKHNLCIVFDEKIEINNNDNFFSNKKNQREKALNATFKLSKFLWASSYMETSDRNIKFFSKEGIAKKGTVGERHRPVAFTAEATKEQKKIARLLDTKESIRWLFVGDSITHGNIVTHGYDSTVQLFEKYIREELGRPKDIIINSSIWASTIEDYIIGEYAHVRLDWNADVVMVMLGTNDAGMSATREENVFKKNYYNLLKKIKEYNPNAIIVIRTPIYTEEEYRVTNLLPILSWMKEISFNEDRLTDMYIDQYIPTTRMLLGFPWLYDEGRGNDLIYRDDLHPNELGHLILFKQLLNELGLCNADSAMLDFYYDKIKYFTEIREEELEEYINFEKAFINEERNNDNSFKESEVSNLEVTMDVSAFVEDYPQMGNVTLTVINTMTGERREKTANRKVKIGENFDKVIVEWETDTKLTISDLNLNGKYEIEVSGWSVDENKFYSFINSKSKD